MLARSVVSSALRATRARRRGTASCRGASPASNWVIYPPPEPGDAEAMRRVRVGRYADRSRAEQVLRRLEQEGHFKPWITESVSAAPPDAGGPYTVQVTALPAAEAAEQVVGRLIARGFPAYLHPPAPDDAEAMHRVRVGRYADRSRAEQVLRRLLEQEEQFKPWITR